jgi:hypothetical protein
MIAAGARSGVGGRSLVIAAVLALAAPRDARAQGNLSTQGLGFPPGQMSTASKSLGGASGEIDPLSPLNPAAIGLFRDAIIVFQAEPEYRTLRIDDRTQRTSISRFPLFAGALPLGRRWVVSLAASTLLDRTWETTTRDSQVLAGDTIRASLGERSDGSITDLRMALAFAPAPWMRIGIGAHGFTGRDVLQTTRLFDDTVRFATDVQSTTISFGGNGVSAGVQTIWPRVAAVGASYRRGGTMRAYSGNKVVGSGFAPDHFGASIVYLGIAGTTLGARAAKDTWSRLRGVAQTLNIHEDWDIGVGGDVIGPRFGTNAVILRAGGRWRTLPFSVSGTPVKEQTWSGGFAIPMAMTRVELSLGVLRSARTGGANMSEDSWTISTGFSIKP